MIKEAFSDALRVTAYGLAYVVFLSGGGYAGFLILSWLIDGVGMSFGWAMLTLGAFTCFIGGVATGTASFYIRRRRQ